MPATRHARRSFWDRILAGVGVGGDSIGVLSPFSPAPISSPQPRHRRRTVTDYEKGSPAWDIGQILTRHAPECEKPQTLRQGAHMRLDSQSRLTRAWASPCTCTAGDSDSEHTSIRKLNAHE